MDSLIFIAALLFAYFILKPLLMNDLNIEKAGEMIRKGAIVIDVRSEEEYQKAHIKTALNIPLNEISEKIADHTADRNSGILLYCRSGSRSFVGKKTLQRLNYINVYNLGSFKRAKRMVENA